MTESEQSPPPTGEPAQATAVAKPADEAKPAEQPAEAAPQTGPAKTTDKTGPARTTDIVPGPGGVMTDEVGVVTGDLTLRTELAGTELTLRVQYKDAEEWYAVTGGKATLADPADLDAVHRIAVALLNRPEG
jgi:hypothetical protein